MSSQAAVKKINNKIRMTPGEKVGVTIIYGMLILFSLAFLMPFLYVVSTSITSEKALAEKGGHLTTCRLYTSDAADE